MPPSSPRLPRVRPARKSDHQRCRIRRAARDSICAIPIRPDNRAQPSTTSTHAPRQDALHICSPRPLTCGQRYPVPDPDRLDISEGDLLEIFSPRSAITAHARISEIRTGVVFVPFHYGYWDTDARPAETSHIHRRVANELTLTDWDPASKQPIFKIAGAGIRKVSSGNGTPLDCANQHSICAGTQHCAEDHWWPAAMAQEETEY